MSLLSVAKRVALVPRLQLVGARSATGTFYNSTLDANSTTSSVPQQQQQLDQQQRRGYISRAHPQKKPLIPIPIALEETLVNVKQRQKKRANAWDRLKKHREKHEKPDDGKPYRPVDETIELVVNLNVDPRKPGQSLRGSLELPNGTGKKINVVVFTEDQDIIDEIEKKQLGPSVQVGGESLIDSIVDGTISVDSFERSLATQDMMPVLGKKLARLLGPRGLMPNPKVGNVVSNSTDLMEMLESQMGGREIQYRTEKEGILHFPVGKSSFGSQKLLENAGAVMQKVYEIKPESYGKAKKKKKGGGGGGGKGKAASMDVYILSAFLSSTFTKSFKLDLRTLDPSSAYFLSDPNAQP